VLIDKPVDTIDIPDEQALRSKFLSVEGHAWLDRRLFACFSGHMILTAHSQNPFHRKVASGWVGLPDAPRLQTGLMSLLVLNRCLPLSYRSHRTR
jgi:hypothetical protein